MKLTEQQIGIIQAALAQHRKFYLDAAVILPQVRRRDVEDSVREIAELEELFRLAEQVEVEKPADEDSPEARRITGIAMAMRGRV